MMDVGWYAESIRELLLQPSRESYENLLQKKKSGYTNLNEYDVPAWKDSFIEYYDKNIHPDIESLAGYNVRTLCPEYFNEISGLTTNHSEGMNFVFKDLQDHKELPLDCVCLSLFNLSIYYCNEIKKGFGNTGEFRLRPGFMHYFIDSKHINRLV